MYFDAVDNAYRNPEHAAIRSYPNAFTALILSAIIEPVLFPLTGFIISKYLFN